MKILFIGNSYTYYNDMPAIFKALCEENGQTVEVASVTKGGWLLHRYLDVENEYAQALRKHFAEQFDVVFMQEQSCLPVVDHALFEDGAKRIREAFGENVKRFIFYATWGRKEGSEKLTELGMTRESMTDALEASYKNAAQSLGFELSPVGRAFLEMKAIAPEIDLYNSDLTHPSRLGSCLAALVHYRTVFGELPESLEPLALSDTERAALFAAAQC